MPHLSKKLSKFQVETKTTRYILVKPDRTTVDMTGWKGSLFKNYANNWGFIKLTNVIYTNVFAWVYTIQGNQKKNK